MHKEIWSDEDDLGREPRAGSDESRLEREARKRVRALKGFYSHAASYVLVNLMLVAINLLTSPEYFWAIWPILGWGVGLLSNAVQVYGMFGFGSREWEERKVREYILQRQSGMSAAQVKQLMRDELQAERTALPGPAEWERMRQRLEHLEAIVTTEEWDRSRAASTTPSLLPDDAEGGETPQDRAAQPTRRVR